MNTFLDGYLSQDALNENIIGNFITKIKTKIAKQREKIKRDNTPKEVLIKDIKKEQNDFKVYFYKTLNKYPRLKKKYERMDHVLEEKYNLYEYYIVFGEIEDVIGDDFYDLVKKFEEEIWKFPLKYNEVDGDYDGNTYEYGLMSKQTINGFKGVYKLSDDTIQHESVIDVTQSMPEIDDLLGL